MAETKDGITVQKITIGFVNQTFRILPADDVNEVGKMFCESQEFTAGEVSWEDQDGEAIHDITTDDASHPLEMKQPQIECPDCGAGMELGEHTLWDADGNRIDLTFPICGECGHMVCDTNY